MMERQVITFHHILKDQEGKIVDSSREENPLIFLEGAGQIIPGLEAILIKLNKGDTRDVKIPYQDGYGAYDQKLVMHVDRNKFPKKDMKVGDMFEVGQDHQFQLVTVIEITELNVTIDANHPLAGKDLFFNIEIIDKRDATTEELAHGHVHGAGGHHH